MQESLLSQKSGLNASNHSIPMNYQLTFWACLIGLLIFVYLVGTTVNSAILRARSKKQVKENWEMLREEVARWQNQITFRRRGEGDPIESYARSMLMKAGVSVTPWDETALRRPITVDVFPTPDPDDPAKIKPCSDTITVDWLNGLVSCEFIWTSLDPRICLPDMELFTMRAVGLALAQSGTEKAELVLRTLLAERKSATTRNDIVAA
jgi:hypothetical protein